MPTVQHLVETRFSLRTGPDPPAKDWLDYRLELLRKYTLPSMAAQTASPFTWLLLCDESTDPEVLAQLREAQAAVPGMRIALTGGENPAPLEIVRSAVRPDTDVLITTRLDSDDAIAEGYLALVRSYAEPFHRSEHERMLVNCPRGYRLDTRPDTPDAPVLYRDWMPNSPFHSLFERPQRSQPQTVLAFEHDELRERYAGLERLEQLHSGHTGGHARMHQHYPTHQDESMPAWLILVHGGNMINRIPPTAHRQPAGARPAGIEIDG